MRCLNCSAENPETAKFCIQCASPFKRRCERCGFENPPGAKFCAECAASLGCGVEQPSSASATPAASAIRVTLDSSEPDSSVGERKTVTALFADIKGSMDLIEDIDPEEARAIVDPAIKLMIDAAHRYDGYIVQSTGDGIFALFGAPVAREDHPQRALYAALRMQEDVKRFAEKLRAEKGVNLQVRVGVNTGEVVVRSIRTDDAHTEYTPIGHSTSLASRLQTLASPGSIAVSETVRNLIEGYFALKSLGPARIKGVSDPVNVYEVIGLGPLRTRLQRSAGRGFTKFVGRHRELDAMKAAAEQAKLGHGQIVAAIAEAGVGKSRLFHEFKAMLSSEWMVLEAFSISHGKASSFLPVIDLLWNYFKISDEDDERSRREKVAGRLAILDPSLESTRPYLFTLLGIVEGDEHLRRWEQTFDRLDEYLHGLQKKDPLAQMDAQLRRRRTLDAIKKILLRESLNQPLMLVFEDLHWIDDETQSLLDLLADSIGTSRVLMLVNYRPEYSHLWTNKTYYTQVRLDPLGRESAENMLTALLGDEASLKPLCDLIVRKTEGNPFFMEEIVQGLIEDGALIRNGTTRLTRSLDSLKIPATVQAMLASRIDRLRATEKDLLQTLAVIGKEFGLGLVSAVTAKSDDEIMPTLSALQLAEFIYEQPTAGELEYTFKHALTQEVAYSSILIERRRLLHERAARAIEAIYADSLDDHLADLGHHFQRAGNATEAVKYLHRAGIVAATKYAFPEAISHLSAGLELVETLPESSERALTEWKLLTVLTDSLSVTAGAGSSKRGEALMRIRELCDQLGDDARLFYVVSNRINFHGVRDELAKERELCEQAVAIAERSNNAAFLENACSCLGYSLWKLGEFSAAREQLERAIATPRTAHHRPGVAPAHYKMLAAMNLAFVQWILGFPEQAAKTSADALDLVRAESAPGTLAFGLIYSAELHRFVRNPDKTAVLSGEALEIAIQSGFSLLEAQAEFEHGWSLIQGPQVAAGLAEMNRAMEALVATGAVASAWRAGPLAEAWANSGNPARGLVLLREALVKIQKTGERVYEAELRRLIGELTLATDQSNSHEAQRAFDEAIEVARLQNAKSLELRATLSLARLLDQQGERDEARAMLAEIYSWFTEGFDTADLKDAKVLLDSLGA